MSIENNYLAQLINRKVAEIIPNYDDRVEIADYIINKTFTESRFDITLGDAASEVLGRKELEDDPELLKIVFSANVQSHVTAAQTYYEPAQYVYEYDCEITSEGDVVTDSHESHDMEPSEFIDDVHLVLLGEKR